MKGVSTGEVFAVVLTQLDVTQLLTSQKTHVASKKLKKQTGAHNGPEHRSNTADKCPDRLRTAAQHTRTHKHLMCVSKSREIHQDFFQRLKSLLMIRHETLISSITAEREWHV